MWRFLQILISAMLCLTAGAEIIPAHRLPLWTGNVGVRGGIPDSSGMQIYTNLPICSATAINDAILNCPSNQVVQLTNGTYALSASIMVPNYKHGVVVRGAGRTNTVLDFSASGIVELGSFSGDIGNIAASQSGTPDVSVNWTAGYTIGTTNITVASASGLAVGDIVGLDQVNDNNDVSSAASEGSSPLCACPQCGRSTYTRSQLQWTKITAINSTTLTIDPAVFVGNWASGTDPEVWLEGQTWLERVGIEDLTIDGLDSSGGSIYSTMFIIWAGYECWLKNVRFLCLGAGHCHIATYVSLRCEFSACDLYGALGGALSYGFAPIFSTGDFFHDNVLDTITGSIAPGWCTHGLAMTHNYIRNNYQTLDPNWNAAAITMHDAYGCGWLVEGNFMNTFLGDMIHGPGGRNTIFRNRLTGRNTNTTQITHCVTLQTTNRHYNVVGNVCGTTNYHTAVMQTTSTDVVPESIFWFGWVYGGDPVGCTPTYDPGVTNTIYLHMNYDTVTSTNNGIVWNATNSDHTLPNSLLYTNKPTQFGFLSWPPFDPANGSAIVNNEKSYTNLPAGYRYEFGTNPPASSGSQGQGSGGRIQVNGAARITTIRKL